MSERQALARFDALLDLEPTERASALARLALEEPEVGALVSAWFQSEPLPEPRLEPEHYTPLLPAPPDETESAPNAGDRIGPYKLVHEIGRGGMGSVWLAERAEGDFTQQVALKLIRPDLGSPEAEPRFRRERQILAGLKHPNIAQLLDGGVTPDGRLWLAMEYIAGNSLRELVLRGPLPPKRLIAIAAQVASGLAHAHAAGIVHRDLKPDNLMVAKEGYAKILDFGVAKLLADDAPIGTHTATQPGRMIGTTPYMSPEQASGEHIDFRSDQFALGALLYEAATGRAAFARGTPTQTVAAVLRDTPPELDSLDGVIPPGLARILRRCLEKDPADRYGATSDLAHDLAELEHSAAPQPAMRARPSSRLVAVAALLILVLGLGLWLGRTGPRVAEAPTQPSIAVLPFTDMSQAKDQEYFSDGMSEELLNLLAKVPGLHVAGRTSAFAFKGKNDDLRSIGQKLGVATVLEGSVRKSGDRVRITAQLINVADGFHLWSETYDHELTDVFALQDEISAAVVAALKLKLLPELEHAAKAHGTQNMEAYNALLLGRELHNRGNPEDVERVIQSYQKAITLDPDYAAAYALLAISLITNAQFATEPQQAASARRRAAEAVKRALELDPASGQAHGARALLRMLADWDWSGAEVELREAMRLAPSDPAVLRWFAIELAATGKLDESIKVSKRSTELDPLSAINWGNLGYYLLCDERDAEAGTALRRTLELGGGTNVIAHYNLGTLELLQGKPEAAVAWYRKIPESQYFRWTGIAMAEHQLGHAQESRAALDALLAMPQRPSFWIAAVYTFRDERDRAFEWLGHAADEHDPYVRNVRYDRIISRLSDDPRYDVFLKRVGLPPAREVAP